MEFVKYHGLGNDFVILLSPDGGLHDPAISPERARALCERGFGVGADGVMWAAPPTVPDASLRMALINSDGSLPEMCGNGLRCLVKFAVDALGYRDNPLRIETRAGVLSSAWEAAEGSVSRVTVAMSRPTFTPAAIPVSTSYVEVAGDARIALELAGRRIEGVAVNTGNPHFVIFGDSSQGRALTDGPPLERHPAFPLRANIEFAEVLDRRHLRVTVWERGCGLTLACGTGATAATAAAVRLGSCEADTPIRVDLPGGTLEITIASDFSAASMTGPATRVFRGVIDD
jgi:diaminopimelate epimerase